MFPLGVGSISTDARVDVVATRGPSSPWVDVFDAVDRTAQVPCLLAVLLRSGAAHAALSIETEGEEAWRPSLRDSLIRRPFLTHLQTMRVLFELVDGRAALHAPSCLFAHCRDG